MVRKSLKITKKESKNFKNDDNFLLPKLNKTVAIND